MKSLRGNKRKLAAALVLVVGGTVAPAVAAYADPSSECASYGAPGTGDYQRCIIAKTPTSGEDMARAAGDPLYAPGGQKAAPSQSSAAPKVAAGKVPTKAKARHHSVRKASGRK